MSFTLNAHVGSYFYRFIHKKGTNNAIVMPEITLGTQHSGVIRRKVANNIEIIIGNSSIFVNPRAVVKLDDVHSAVEDEVVCFKRYKPIQTLKAHIENEGPDMDLDVGDSILLVSVIDIWGYYQSKEVCKLSSTLENNLFKVYRYQWKLNCTETKVGDRLFTDHSSLFKEEMLWLVKIKYLTTTGVVVSGCSEDDLIYISFADLANNFLIKGEITEEKLTELEHWKDDRLGRWFKNQEAIDKGDYCLGCMKKMQKVVEEKKEESNGKENIPVNGEVPEEKVGVSPATRVLVKRLAQEAGLLLEEPPLKKIKSESDEEMSEQVKLMYA